GKVAVAGGAVDMPTRVARERVRGRERGADEGPATAEEVGWHSPDPIGRELQIEQRVTQVELQAFGRCRGAGLTVLRIDVEAQCFVRADRPRMLAAADVEIGRPANATRVGQLVAGGGRLHESAWS